MVKIAVVGMGKMGLLHSSTLCGFNDVEFIGFADDNKFMVDTFRKLKPNWHINKDYKSLINDNDIDVVFITTPISTHYEMIKFCIDKNISFRNCPIDSHMGPRWVRVRGDLMQKLIQDLKLTLTHAQRSSF